MNIINPRIMPFLKGTSICILISAVTLATGGCASGFQKACESGKDPAVITDYIKKGANPNSPMGGSGFTALQHAACTNQNPAIIKALINEGADPNWAFVGQGIVCMTPLQMAAWKNKNLEIAQALIDGGAQVNLLPPAGMGYTGVYRNMTPLAIALATGKTAVADVIRKNGGHE